MTRGISFILIGLAYPWAEIGGGSGFCVEGCFLVELISTAERREQLVGSLREVLRVERKPMNSKLVRIRLQLQDQRIELKTNAKDSFPRLRIRIPQPIESQDRGVVVVVVFFSLAFQNSEGLLHRFRGRGKESTVRDDQIRFDLILISQPHIKTPWP
ncbi:hypothetical protein B0O99DRAFT_168429 [Bisporella sp. PMI_857]|nr:hypothetical protein B0O99DRAFT_168429 [Bisporella sp. PMI_857]